MEKKQNIELAPKALGLFVEITSKWLRRTASYKEVELCISSNEKNEIVLSAGSDAHFIKATLPVITVGLEKPVYLKLSYLEKVTFSFDKLSLVEPKADGEGQWAQFMSPGFNFRIPLGDGRSWKKNVLDLKSEEDLLESTEPGFALTSVGLATIKKYCILPNSFKEDRWDPFINLKLVEGAVQVFGNDQRAGFVHTFPLTCGISFTLPQGNPGISFSIAYSFLDPYTKLGSEKSKAVIKYTDRLWEGYLRCDEHFNFLSWGRPQDSKLDIEDTPGVISNLRGSELNGLVCVDQKQFKSNIQKVLTFHDEQDMQEGSILLSAMLTQYRLSADLITKTIAEGEALDEVKPIKARFPSRCLEDYVSQFQDGKLDLEIFQNAVVFHQTCPDATLIYCAPLAQK